MDDTTLAGIGEVAAALSVSRRTIERWIALGRLMALPDPADKRKKLVDIEAASALVRRRRPNASVDVAAPKGEEAIGVAQSSDARSGSVADDAVIERALQSVCARGCRLIAQTVPGLVAASVEPVPSGPLGRDLRRLVDLARERAVASKLERLEWVESVLQLFFGSAISDVFAVPRSFWRTDIGKIVALVKFRAFQPDELISIGAAAQHLNVTRSTVYGWMDDRTLDYVRDDFVDRFYLVRQDVLRLVSVRSQTVP